MKATPIFLNAVVPENLANQRLDVVLSQLFPDYSRSRLQSWIREGYVTINEKPIFSPKEKVTYPAAITINALLESHTEWTGEAIDVALLYQDEDILVINKPVNLVVHPAAGNYQGTLVNALLHLFPELAQLPRAGIVHRLDKDTSGVMVVARSLVAQTSLVSQLQTRTMSREYTAIVKGALISGGMVDAPIARHPRMRTKMAVVSGGKPAKTWYKIAQRFKHYTVLDLKLETGRTHQIRVHMAHIGFPLVGDPAYGGRLAFAQGVTQEVKAGIKQLTRQALHAHRLTLLHPTRHESMSWEAELPDDMQSLIDLLEKND